MADGINLPSSLYTAGAVPLSIEPSVQLATQLALKKQAREDSLNEYFQNTQKDINPSGIRAQDTPGFMDKYKEFTDFYGQNRAAIQNPRLDGGKAMAEYNARHQDMLGFTEQSKNAQNVHQELWKAKSNPATSYMFNTPDAIPAIAAHDLPLTDPHHKDLDLDQMHMNAQPMSIKEMNDLHKGYMQGMVKKTKVGDPVRDNLGNAYQPMGYDPQAQQAFLSRAQQAYSLNPKVRAQAAQIQGDPSRYSQATAAFGKIAGRVPQNEAELYAGESAAQAGLDTQDQIRVNDAQTKSNISLAAKKKFSDYTYGQKVDLKELQSGLELGKARQLKQDDYDRLKQRADDITTGAAAGKGKNIVDENGKRVTEYPIDGLDDFNKMYHTGTQKDGQEPSEYRTNAAGDYVRVVYPDGTFKKISKDDFIGNIAKNSPIRSIKPTTPPPAGATPKKAVIAPAELN